MLNLLKNNLFGYYSRNNTCNGCLMNGCTDSNYKEISKEYNKFVVENELSCSYCFFKFLQILKERNNKSYKKILNYIVENNNIDYIFPCVNKDDKSDKMKQIILNNIISVVELNIE